MTSPLFKGLGGLWLLFLKTVTVFLKDSLFLCLVGVSFVLFLIPECISMSSPRGEYREACACHVSRFTPWAFECETLRVFPRTQEISVLSGNSPILTTFVSA